MVAPFKLVPLLSFYGAYHNNAMNVFIHTIFVPTIFFTALVWLTSTGPLFQVDLPLEWVPKEIQPAIQFNGAFLAASLYGLYYTILEPVAGGSAALLLLGMWIGATHWALIQGAQAIRMATVLHIIAWAFQFLGHGVFEGRKPALLDNLFQSLVLAPLFVWLHVLFLFGYRKPLQAEVQKQVDQQLVQLRAAKKLN